MGIPASIREVTGSENFDQIVAAKLDQWAGRSTRFCGYLGKYETKINSKLRGAESVHQQRDLGIELYLACALLEGEFRVTPEPSKAGPDLLAEIDGTSLYVEVRRFHDRQEAEDWIKCCRKLRAEIEPLHKALDVHLSIRGNYENYRYRRHPGLLHPLDEFEDKLPYVRDFIKDQVLAPPHWTVTVEVPRLPSGFAHLTIKPDGNGAFTCNYPLTYLTEEQRLLDAICRKSKQTMEGAVNVIAFWMTNIEETYDDFEAAIRKRKGLIESEAQAFCTQHKFPSVEECERLWRQCSAFIVSDSEAETPTFWHNPDAETRLPSHAEKAILNGLEFGF